MWLKRLGGERFSVRSSHRHSKEDILHEMSHLRSVGIHIVTITPTNQTEVVLCFPSAWTVWRRQTNTARLPERVLARGPWGRAGRAVLGGITMPGQRETVASDGIGASPCLSIPVCQAAPPARHVQLQTSPVHETLTRSRCTRRPAPRS